MLPVTDRGRSLLQSGAYRHHLRVDIVDADGSTVLAKNIPVADGTISWDIQRTAGHSVANLVIPERFLNQPQYDYLKESLLPTGTTSALTPFGHRARISIGVSEHPGLGVEWFTYPDQLILDARVERPVGAITIECVDMAFLAEQRVLEGRVVLGKGANMRTFIDNLWTQCVGTAATVSVPAGVNTTSGSEQVWNVRGGDKQVQQDRASMTYWGIIRQVARWMTCYVRTVGKGNLELIEIGDRTNQATVETGPDGEITEIITEVNRAQVVNKVIVLFDAEFKKKRRKDNKKKLVPYTALGSAQITSGPLIYGGQMGRLTRVYRESGKKFDTKADILAEANRRAKVRLGDAEDTPGLARAITADCVPMPWLQTYDYITVRFPNGATEKFDIKAVEHSLNPPVNNRGSTFRGWWDADGSTLDPVLFPQTGAVVDTFLAGEQSTRHGGVHAAP